MLLASRKMKAFKWVESTQIIGGDEALFGPPL